MPRSSSRRHFLKQSLAVSAGAAFLGTACRSSMTPTGSASDPLYRVSLAEWSLNRQLFGGELDHLDFARTAREDYDLDAVEYVNQFFKDRADDEAYLREMNQRAEDHGVRQLLIMVDGEGRLGDPDAAARAQAVENHHRWVRAAQFLGGHSIRVNAQSEGSYEEQQRLAADGLRALAEYADDFDINVIVENHGGLSSNGAWLVGVMERADHPRVGTLPDFGNFRISAWGDPDEWYDRYQGIEEMMPYAKAVSAKSHAFDENGDETQTDYRRVMQIVTDHGYHGYVGIEYEGRDHPAPEGIRLTRDLLYRVRDELAAG